MEKIYIDTQNKIWVDPEVTKIFFDDKRTPIDVGDNQEEQFFRALIKGNGTEIKYNALIEKLIIPDKQNLFQKRDLMIKNILNKHGIAWSENEIEIGKQLVLANKKSHGTIDGSYTLYLPTQRQSIVTDLSAFYWDAYAIIGAQKNSGKYDATTGQIDIEAKLGEVYQMPKLIPHRADDKWGWKPDEQNNILLVAPNGYGKTAFLRSLLLSCISDHNEELTESEKTNYQKIKQYHKLSEDFLPLYIECQYIDSDTLTASLKEATHSWIYHALNKRLLIRRNIFEDTFFQSVSSHLEKSNVLLLIDGFDEIKEQERNLLRTALTKFRESVNFNPHLSIVVATRPLSTEDEFIGFSKWHIANIQQNENFLHDYVTAYAGSANKTTIIDTITANPYLSALVSTPTTLVWTIKTFLEHSPVYETVETIISEIMLRNNYEELRTKQAVCKKIYAELAYQYLTQLSDTHGIRCTERDFFSWLEHALDLLVERGDRKILKFLESKTEEELEQLFFTQAALIEFDEGRLHFSTPIYAYHLVARRILTLLDNCEAKRLQKDLDKIAYAFRYKVIVATVTIGEHYSHPKLKISIPADIDVSQFLADTFFEYLTAKLNDPNTIDAEKAEVLITIREILDEIYGSNVFTGEGHNPSYKRSFEELLD